MTRYASLLAIVLLSLISHPVWGAEAQLSHVVFFTLADSSQANQEKLAAACHKYLANHEGTAYFAVGTRAKEMSREVNDQEFDVSLIVVFKGRKAHDQYQKHPRHLQFIEENQKLWSSVRVFDSFLPGMPKR